jgi:chromosome segregation ATPase
MAACNEKISDHESRITDTATQIMELFDIFKGLSSDLQAQVQTNEKEGEDLKKNMEEENKKHTSVQQMLSNLVLKVDKASSDVANTFKGLQDKEDKIQLLNSKIEEHTTITTRHGGDITRIDQNLKDISVDIQKEGERITSAEQKHGALKTKAELTEQSLRNLAASHKEANHKIEVQSRDIGIALSRLQTSERRLDETSTHLHAVNNEVTSTTEEVSKMSGRVDIAHANLLGMGKGFQNAHSKVVGGQDGMLPYKDKMPSSTLPALPDTLKKSVAGSAMTSASARTCWEAAREH